METIFKFYKYTPTYLHINTPTYIHTRTHTGAFLYTATFSAMTSPECGEIIR